MKQINIYYNGHFGTGNFVTELESDAVYFHELVPLLLNEVKSDGHVSIGYSGIDENEEDVALNLPLKYSFFQEDIEKNENQIVNMDLDVSIFVMDPTFDIIDLGIRDDFEWRKNLPEGYCD